MAHRVEPGHGPNRWSPETVSRASEVRAWMDEEAAEGRPVGEDEVWDHVTGRWPSIPTHQAEHVLNLAMDAPAVALGGTRVVTALRQALREACDGTYGHEDMAAWSLEVGPGLPGGNVSGLLEGLVDAVRGETAPGTAPGRR